MGEHKFPKEITPNGDEAKPPLSSHIVEVGDFSYTDGWGPGIEEMYTRIRDRAQADDSLIVNVIQTVNVMQEVDKGNLFQPRIIVILTAQRIGREDLERQQRQMQITGGPRR